MDRGAWWVTVHGITNSWTQCRPQCSEWLSTMFSIHSPRNAFCSDSGKHACRDPQSYGLNSDLFDKYPVKRTEQIQLLSPTKKILWMYIIYKYISMMPSFSFRPLVCSPHLPSDPIPAVCVCVCVCVCMWERAEWVGDITECNFRPSCSHRYCF